MFNLMAADRYRERTTVARSKSDAVDALMLANVPRTDRHAHRVLPADSELVRAIAVLARARQDAGWNRQHIANQLRSAPREYFPAALQAFHVKRIGLPVPKRVPSLETAPTSAAAARLTKTRLTLPKRAGRQRNLDTWIERLYEIFHAEALRHSPRIEDAFGQQTRTLLLQLDALRAPTSCWPRPKQRSSSTPTRRSSPASPASARSTERGSSPRSAMTAAGSAMHEH